MANNTYIYLGSGGSYAPIAVEVKNGSVVTLTENSALVNDTTFTMNITVDAASITFGVGNTSTKTNGQVRITAIEVVYQ